MDFQKMIDYRNTRSPFSKHLGIRLVELGPGHAKTVKTVVPEDLNPLQYAHGGVYFSLADTACGSAMASHGYMAVTVNAAYNFLRAARVGDVLSASAVEVKTGKTLCVYDVRVTDQNDALLGTGSFTFYRLDQKLEF